MSCALAIGKVGPETPLDPPPIPLPFVLNKASVSIFDLCADVTLTTHFINKAEYTINTTYVVLFICSGFVILDVSVNLYYLFSLSVYVVVICCVTCIGAVLWPNIYFNFSFHPRYIFPLVEHGVLYDIEVTVGDNERIVGRKDIEQLKLLMKNKISLKNGTQLYYIHVGEVPPNKEVKIKCFYASELEIDGVCSFYRFFAVYVLLIWKRT